MTSGLAATIELRRSPAFRLEADIQAPAGRTVALLGPNGAGKSTVVRALAGTLPLDGGRIVLGDVVLDDPGTGVFVPSEAREVGVVFQEGLLFPHLDVADNVAFGLRSRGVRRSEARRRSLAWLERLELGSLADRRPDALSGGQAQRVALARALATEPRLLLLDEPMGALDVATRAETRRVLAAHLGEFAGPRILITHDPAEAFLLADEVHVLEEGRVTQRGSPEEIRLRPRTPYAADLGGSNFLRGVARDGVVDVAGHHLFVADHDVGGAVIVTLRPATMSVHLTEPAGSFRNRWRTTVDGIEPLGDRVRILTGAPLPVTVEVTREACAELGLGAGVRVWLALKATEIVVQPDAPLEVEG